MTQTDNEIQRRLASLDACIATLEKAKRDAVDHDLQLIGEDPDLSVIEEAKDILKRAEEHYGNGDLKKAWVGVCWAEGCIIVGQRELDDFRRLSAEIDRLVK